MFGGQTQLIGWAARPGHCELDREIGRPIAVQVAGAADQARREHVDGGDLRVRDDRSAVLGDRAEEHQARAINVEVDHLGPAVAVVVRDRARRSARHREVRARDGLDRRGLAGSGGVEEVQVERLGLPSSCHEELRHAVAGHVVPQVDAQRAGQTEKASYRSRLRSSPDVVNPKQAVEGNDIGLVGVRDPAAREHEPVDLAVLVNVQAYRLFADARRRVVRTFEEAEIPASP